ncbi:DUF6884 domain-containing protein [Gracilibacillus timonensis]|uniref:DUF6884 domain-containing protein n=1 Tax=Gracilibacillus timonensis TaxID=1816696 RepID=UPI00082630A5|nr:DUF6884 domain-containing protein [Gracilibacillus timonensis]
MEALAILPCGRRKIWDKNPAVGGVKAADAYIGVLHRLCRQYASLYVGEWAVISGKHGLLLPDDIVPENYDVTFGQKHPDVISIAQLKQQVIDKQLDQFPNIIALTGKKYQPIIKQVFTTQEIQYPLLGTKGIGKMQQLLKHSIEQGQPLHKQ